MSRTSEHALQPMLSKLELWHPLDAADREALLDLPYRVIKLRPREYIVREGDHAQSACLMLGGFAFRHKLAGNGGRQIFSISMKGDLADLQNSLLGTADHNLQALNNVEVALIPADALLAIAFEHPAIGRAMWRETLVDASIFREWTLNVGRRDARSRTAHMLCEFALRLEAAGLGERCNYELPMTQEDLGDALGLTSVHVNRTLKSLREDQLIKRTSRSVQINDFQTLATVGDFDSAYLHFPPSAPLSKIDDNASG